MNVRLAFWFSAALNLVFLVAIVLAAKSRSTPAPPRTPATAPIAAVQISGIELASTNPASTSADQPFLWSQITSDDLKMYRDNLRAIECPSATIRDIILAEINARFNRRWKKVLGPLHSRFWELAPDGARSIESAFAEPLNAIKNARMELIDDVLGGGSFIVRGIETEPDYGEKRGACLPPEKRQPYLRLEEAHRRRIQQWAAGIDWKKNDGPMSPENQRRMQALQREFDDQLRQLLTPEEMNTIKLSDSPTAGWAKHLSGFEPSEEEWRKVVEFQDGSNQAHAVASDRTSAQEEAFRQEEQTKQAIKAALSSERYAQYELANNPEFQRVHNITQRYGLADSIAAQVVDMQQAAITAACQVRADTSLSPDQRQSALQEIQQETVRTLSGALGDQPFATYQEYGGGWLPDLGRTP